MSNVQVVISSGIPVTSALAGITSVAGISLAMARRYPLAVFMGCALAFAGFALWTGQEIHQRNAYFSIPDGVIAAYWAWQTWRLRETVR